MMLSAAFVVAMLALFASITAVGLFSQPLEKNQLGKSISSVQAVQALLPVAAMGAVLAAVVSIYRQLCHAAGAGTEVRVGVICAAVGVIQFFSFVLPPAAQVDDDGARARAIGTAAVHVLPASATATFYLSLALLFVAHVRAGEWPVVQILIKVVLGATAILVGLLALAL
jgi:hypothetical protein